MSIESNAFNFMSFSRGSVDPRTGLYTFSVDLPELHANALTGPDLPLKLSFNPLNNDNKGFGQGWSLQLSRYNTLNGMLNLFNGESFEILDNGPDHPALIPECKIKGFVFKNISINDQRRYRVAHAKGLVEILEPQAGDSDIALPVRVMNPSGHGITLGYDERARLTSISDDLGRTVLKIVRVTTSA